MASEGAMARRPIPRAGMAFWRKAVGVNVSPGFARQIKEAGNFDARQSKKETRRR
jgi:hypothetical protein